MESLARRQLLHYLLSQGEKINKLGSDIFQLTLSNLGASVTMKQGLLILKQSLNLSLSVSFSDVLFRFVFIIFYTKQVKHSP